MSKRYRFYWQKWASRRENFKKYSFLYNTIYFWSKLGCVTLFIFIFIILILYLFLNHFFVSCMCDFVCYGAVNSIISKSFLYIGKSFPRQNFHFCCSCGGFFGDGKGLFQSENLRSFKIMPQIPTLKLHFLKMKKKM